MALLNIIIGVYRLYFDFLYKIKCNLFENIPYKIIQSIQIAITFSVPAWLLSKITQWTVSNHDYCASVLVCISIDHLIGSYYHAFKAHDFNFKSNIIGILQKVGLCVIGIILFEIIHNTLQGITFIYEYLKVTTHLVVILYPASSAFKNMSEITNGIFPPIGWIKKLKAFNDDLSFKNLNDNDPHSKF